MKILCNGKSVEPSRVTYRDVGFGLDSRMSDVSAVEIRVDSDLFGEAVRTSFDFFAREAQADDGAYADLEHIGELRRNGYSGFDDMVSRDPDAVAAVVCEYLGLQLLEGLFPQRDEGVVCVITSLVNIAVSGGMVHIRGMCVNTLATTPDSTGG